MNAATVLAIVHVEVSDRRVAHGPVRGVATRRLVGRVGPRAVVRARVALQAVVVGAVAVVAAVAGGVLVGLVRYVHGRERGAAGAEVVEVYFGASVHRAAVGRGPHQSGRHAIARRLPALCLLEHLEGLRRETLLNDCIANRKL